MRLIRVPLFGENSKRRGHLHKDVIDGVLPVRSRHTRDES